LVIPVIFAATMAFLPWRRGMAQKRNRAEPHVAQREQICIEATTGFVGAQDQQPITNS
jgi:hypothetical protein